MLRVVSHFLRKHWLVFALVVLVGIFILQNARVVEVRFLFWRLETSLAIVLLAVLGAGSAAGWILARRPRR